MNRWLAVVVLGLSIVTATMGWRKAVEHFSHRTVDTPRMIAQGGYPVPPDPFKR